MINYLLSTTLLASIFARISKIFVGDIIYVIILLPLLIIAFKKLFLRKKISYVIHKVDFAVLVFLAFILLNLFITSLRGSFISQLIFILYVVVPIFIYPYVRLIHYNLASFSYLIFLFTFVYSVYVIIEFLLYFNMPELQGVITYYLQHTVVTNNFYPPHVNYPLIGYATKPWGPMFDTSGTGAFLVVLFSFIFDSKQYVSRRFANLVIYLAIAAIFLSGSKSAYLMFIIYIGIRATIFRQNRLTKSSLFIKILLLIAIVISLVSFFTFFFKGDLLNWYVYAMVIEPITKLFTGFYENGIFTLLGSGQESSYYKIYGIGEIDLINSIFRYGLVSMSILIGLILYLIAKSKKRYVQFASMFTMFMFSMVHYQVILKFPASMILFILMAVWVNEEENKVLNRWVKN